MSRLGSLQAKRLKRWLLRLRGAKPSGQQGPILENVPPSRPCLEQPTTISFARVVEGPATGARDGEVVKPLGDTVASARGAWGDRSQEVCLFDKRPSFTINDLPKELFVRILSYDDDSNEGPSLPLVASWTCSRWRDVVLHTPTLWSVVRLCSYGAGLPEILLRSEGCGIDFILDPLSSQSITFPRDVSALLRVLQPHLRRVNSLNLVLPDHECVETVLAELCGVVPNLHALELSLPYDLCSGLQSFASSLSPDVSTAFGAIGCGSGEKLQVLKLRAVPFPWHDLAFSHLTTLCMTAMCTDETAIVWEQLADSLSRNSSTLEELVLDQCEFQIMDEEFDQPVIDLPKLKYLHLRLVDPALITTLLSHVSMPNLETLELEFDADDQCEVFRALFPLADANAPSCPDKHPAVSLRRVRNLTIQGGAYPADLFCEIISRMPDLERLMLGGCVVTSAVISALSISRIARKLTDMWLELCDNYCKFDLDKLARARCGSVRIHEISPGAKGHAHAQPVEVM
ncbi:F-box-like protein [Ceratobasidium sp. AG-Ba]|nr:F-box-like protein [Ceratobasidium sp. AG-Ba]